MEILAKKYILPEAETTRCLVDIKLFLRNEIEQLVLDQFNHFLNYLIQQSEKYKNDLLPGYTHLQLAMPSSFGLWFGAYAESLVDDIITLKAAYDIVNKNPLALLQVMVLLFPSTEHLQQNFLGLMI